MSAKIYAESANIQQDQAKIFFDYYREVAEKIVNEEEQLEKEIAVTKERNVQLNSEASKLNLIMIIAFIAGGAIIISSFFIYIILLLFGGGAVVFGIVKLLGKNKLKKEILENESKIAGFEKAHQEIFRDYKLNKLGIAYVPVAGQVAFENKSFLIDYTGIKEDEAFKLQTLKQGELFTEQINELGSLLNEAPFVENSDETEVVDTDQYSTSIQKVTYHDYFGKLDRNLRTSAYCMDDLDVTSVSLPVLMPDSEYAKYLNEFSTNDPGIAPVFEPFDTTKYQEDIERFRTLNDMKKSLERHSEQFEDVLKNLMMNMASAVQAITKLKVVSTNKLIDQSNQLLFKILKASYNHYSPVLEAEEIERIRNESFDFSDSVENYQPFQLKQSSRVKFDLVSDCWVAEDSSKTNFPFGIHQIHEEIVAPIVQNLMLETRIERLKIYNNIKDQKISYLNKWHQDTEDFYGRNRAESNDLINIMRSTLSEYIAAFNTLAALENTQKGMVENASLAATVVESKNNSAEVFSAFDVKSKEFQKIQQEFSDYMERLKNDIEVKADKFEHIEYFDASLRDGNPKQMLEATNRMHDLDERRKPLIAVNPFYAETSELPPQPNIADLTFEHMSLDLNAIARTALNDLNSNSEKSDEGKIDPDLDKKEDN